MAVFFQIALSAFAVGLLVPTLPKAKGRMFWIGLILLILNGCLLLDSLWVLS